MGDPNIVTRLWKILREGKDPKFAKVDERLGKLEVESQRMRAMHDMKEMNGWGKHG